MSYKNFKTLLNIKLYEVSGDEIGKIKAEEKKGFKYYDTLLPEYCLHAENGSLRLTKDYLQWIDSGEEKYFLFQATTLDDILHEEISNCGIENLLKGIDLRVYFNNLEKLTAYSLTHGSFQAGQHLIIEIIYKGGGYWDDDWDLDISVEGVLTSKLEVLLPIKV